MQDLTNPAGVITNKRSLDTTVLVDDGQTLVLGGLIQDQVSKGEFKVPLLGDIPVLGWLFRYETRKSSKTNLMIFIRPSVLRNAKASLSLSQDRYQSMRGLQVDSQIPWNLILPSMPAPLSPEQTTLPASAVPVTGAPTPPAPSVAASGVPVQTTENKGQVDNESAPAISSTPEATAPVAETAPAPANL